MFALEPIDPAILVSEPPVADPAAGFDAPPVAQTPSLGLKQMVVRWLPTELTAAGAHALSGTWDEPSNEIAAWCVRLDAPDEDAMRSDDDAAFEGRSPRMVGAAAHDGCVLGLSMAAGGTGSAPVVAYTASGAGGVSCYAIDPEAFGEPDAIRHMWRRAAPEYGLATLDVACSGGGGSVAAVGEDGGIVVLSAERGAEAWGAQTEEPALYAACWWDASTLAVAGAVVGLWDVRMRGSNAPALVLAPSPGTHVHLASQLLCLSTDPQPPNRLAAGAADGTIAVWDVRAAKSAPSGGGVPPLLSFGAHTADVWDVQLGSGAHGHDLLSCGGDGLLHAWQLEGLEGDAAAVADAAPTRRTLVQLGFAINSLEVSRHGVLAAASDAQVLTFVDFN